MIDLTEVISGFDRIDYGISVIESGCELEFGSYRNHFNISTSTTWLDWTRIKQQAKIKGLNVENIISDRVLIETNERKHYNVIRLVNGGLGEGMGE